MPHSVKAVKIGLPRSVKALKAPLLYALHVIVRPFDGFWDLKHEKRGTLPAAIVILALWLLLQALDYRYTGFTVRIINWERFNIWLELFTSVVPFFLWCISNWCLTTLMDGKGTLKDIFIASCYALTPFILLAPILIILSNVLLSTELAFWSFFSVFSTVWFLFLMLAATMETHEYSFSKALFTGFLTLGGIGVMLFLFFVLFSLVSDMVMYFVALYREVIFRFY
jgi:hypothetical protein